jgi:DNA-binding CsgD family transcriptional regulator
MVGRKAELDAIFRLVDSLPAHGGSMVLRGEPGIGKTALLQAAGLRAASRDSLVLSTVGVQSEADLAFSSLHQLLVPVLSGPLARAETPRAVEPNSEPVPRRLERLPHPQRAALGTALGLSAGAAPDRFLVGLAVLSLLSEVGEEHPVICIIDDAQWLDEASASVLAFVARRLLAESVVLLFGAREPIEELRGLSELVVEGLREDEARELLGALLQGPLDERVRERVVAEARGNPLALLEMPRGLSPEQLAGGFGAVGVVELQGAIEEGFRRRLEAFSDDTRLLLVVAAAEPTGDPALLWHAAERLGIPMAALDPAIADGLLEAAERVRFRHPLVRSAVYRAAPLSARQRAHAALADATDPDADPDRRAWHEAYATPRPDEEVAAELERCADRAQARGGLAAAAAFLERAVGLTPDPQRRAQRALHAAQVKQRAGAPDAALALLATAEAAPLDELGRARADLLRGQIAFDSVRSSDAPGLLLRAAQRLERLDVGLARDTYLEALSAAEFTGREARGGGVREVALAARGAPSAPGPPRPADLLLGGLATRFTDGYAAAVPALQKALTAFRGEHVSPAEELRWIWLACRTAAQLWDADRLDDLSSRQVRLARDAGALTVLPLTLDMRMCALVFVGGPVAASSLSEELQAAREAVGNRTPSYATLLLAAWRGREADARLIEATREDFVRRNEGIGVVATHWASAVVFNGLGRYEDARAAAELASEHPEDLPFSNWSLPELVVAAVRTGNHERAAEAHARLSEMTSASPTDWALGAEAHSRALLSVGGEAEALYREAIERLGRTRCRVPLARAHLLYGEWLRRERRRVDAREQLRRAQEMLAAMGVEGFAQRAELELLATGERARRRIFETRENLTAQEAQVARLARDGLSNPEIGTRLFISPRTVEYHLHKVFAKLGIGSRNQLEGALPQEAGAGVGA